MNRVLFDALLLLALCTFLHVGGIALISKLPLRWSRATFKTVAGRMRNLIIIACCLIVLHVIEIAIWAVAFIWQKSLPDAETAFYFSGVSYTTIGYGDVVLQRPWRLLAPLEGLTGILMCGLSTAFFFAAVLRVFGRTPTDSADSDSNNPS